MPNLNFNEINYSNNYINIQDGKIILQGKVNDRREQGTDYQIDF